METAKIVLASLLSYAALFLSAKLVVRKQVSQLDFLDYITGITIGSIGAELRPIWRTCGSRWSPSPCTR